MCKGYIPNNCLLRLLGKLVIEGKTNPETISFLLDTGADATVIDPLDAVRLGIDIDNLEESRERIEGVGGSCKTHVLEIEKIKFFHINDGGKIEYHTENVPRVLVGDPEVWAVGSVLGKDVWSNFNIRTDIEHNSFELIRIKRR